MDIKKEQALLELNKLQVEFEKVAQDSRKRKFWSSWYLDIEKKRSEYLGYLDIVSGAAELISRQYDQRAKTLLSDLKETFTKVAAENKKASKSFFADWFGAELREEARFNGYAKKVDNIIKLI